MKPTVEETQNLIKNSGLFNIMGLVCFKSDDIAKSTCEWFTNILQKPPKDFRKTLAGIATSTLSYIPLYYYMQILGATA